MAALVLVEARFFTYSSETGRLLKQIYTCGTHPKYKALKKPAVPCPSCWVVYLQTTPRKADDLR